ncbi:hypothetical protein CLAFUW4_10029 [Fulvia fulva]|uniref:Uncharacterized protein n=1 Tax=Passalora fulva TaxID=5499 RepID=A0A9Q8PIF7_PASFU|nr:uncharacterized protein CLAFUR5_12215 [Fulvia fulva]KAK4615730.1 hypothetical protein CLAFUR4_10033 [Fulvia fulva]KAK4616363.1 hypothetical protein CLAFUR0_10031 [Fulvia fulva]UJO22999.1 hypothetical protein CLAFUR5_12215 [Fulvia fulva]WPV18891.1 hypothetical protein CLAFUW4_10029 [Fulvia fulva]WPV34085.1 hypothetical protein CLAFUW7_10030 [Fulvia fulva]
MASTRQTGATAVPTRNQTKVNIPPWHPPCEQPLQLLYPSHFDDGATRRDIAKVNGHPLGLARRKMIDDFSAAGETHGFTATLSYEEAITGAARFSGQEPPPVTPPFFAITLYHRVNKMELIHGQAIAIIRDSFGVDKPIIRYFEGYYDTDF